MNEIERNRHEKKLIKFVEKEGFTLSAIVPHANYDEFVFYRKDHDDIYNLEISFNGVGYRIATGYNNYIFYQNKGFDFTWENMAFHVEHFTNDKIVDTAHELDGE